MPALPKFLFIYSAASGLLAVCLGAFGAHALKARLDATALAVWQTAVQYQFVHTLALLATVLLLQWHPRSGVLLVTGALFALGIIFFSGSLYALALGGPRWLGPVTPLGGAFFIAGWLCLLVFAIRL